MEIEKFRFPGEFEPQTDVFINWLPDYCAGEDGDKGREVLVEVVKNLLGHVNVHVNCGCETSLEACKQMLADAGVDVSDPDTEGQRNTAADNGDEKFSPFIRFTQFDDWSVSIRDNGPDVMIDDEGNTLAVNMRWSNYSNNDKMEPAQQLARRAGANMAIDLDVFDMVNSDMVSEGGNREFNGKGVMIAVEDTEVVKRNPEYTKEEIEDEYKRVWNLDKIIWIPKPMLEDDDIRKGPIDKMEDGTLIWPGSFAAHADEYCRFVDEDTVLLAEVTEEEAAEGPISAENKRQFYIPRGFGHGFVTLTDDVDFCYKADNLYDHPSDRSIRFDDPAIGVDWGVTDPILSDKDKNAPLLADSDCNFVYGKGE